MPTLTGLLGVAALIGIAWAISENRRRFPWRVVIGGVVLQLLMAVFLMKFRPAVMVFEWIAMTIAKVIGFADSGISFVFSPQMLENGAPWGFIFAVRVLPVIIYFAALMAVLYHLGIMQRIVAALAWLLEKTLAVSGAEALAMAANVFVGQTEAPLCIKPYLDKMSRAGLATLMVGGFATIAGSVLAGYVGFLAPMPAPGADESLRLAAEAKQAEWIRHLLTASVMSAPAAFVMARILVPPEPGDDEAQGPVEMVDEKPAANVLDAAALGATDGLRLALNVGAMLIAFVALLNLLNWPLQALGDLDGIDGWLEARGVDTLNIQVVLGWIFSPLAWAMGVAWADAGFVGQLMGEKLVLTEFIAFGSLAGELNAEGGPSVSDRSAAIAAFALCGFANFGSIGIQIGGLSAIAPSRRPEFVSLAFRAMLGGAFASWMTAAIASLFL